MKPLDFIVAALLLLLAFGQWDGCTLPGVTSGPRLALIVHEANKDTPATGDMFVALRAGEPAKYLTEHKHELLILDNDDANSLLAKFAPYDDAKPELLIIAPPDKLLSREPLPANAAAVVSALKARGG